MSANPPGLGAGVEGAVAGAAVLLTIYGAAILVASSALGEELVPDDRGLTGLILVALIVIGAVLGAGMASRADR